MKTRFLSFLILVLSLHSASHSKAQVSGNYLLSAGNVVGDPEKLRELQAKEALIRAQQPAGNQLLIEVNGLYNAIAGSHLAIFHLSQLGSTAREADSLVNLRIDRFLRSLKSVGVPEKNCMTDMLSLLPVFEVAVEKKLFSKTYNEVPAGFEIQKNIHVRYDDPGMLDEIISSAAFQEIYDLVKVEYFVENSDAIYTELRAKASEIIAQRIKQYEALGIEVKGQWKIVSDRQSAFYPLERYEGYLARAKPSMQAIRKRDEWIEAPQQPTLFYNMHPESGYDFVVNPSFVSPPVQFTYNLQVLVSLERKNTEPKVEVRTETKSRYFVIGTTGDVRELPIP